MIRTARGFTLVEILIAAAIFSIGAVAIGRAFQACFFADYRAEAVLKNSAALQKTVIGLFLDNNKSSAQALSNEQKVTIEHKEWVLESIQLDQYHLMLDMADGLKTGATLLLPKPVLPNQSRKEN